MRKDLGYSLRRLTELMVYLLSAEARGLSPGYTEIQEALKTDFKTAQRYILALKEVGWVEIQPTERKNVVRLTERGRCVARCLVAEG